MLNNKYAFLEALVIAVFVFSAGIAIGVYFENNRSGQIQNLYYDYEITVSDVSASLDILSSSNQSCNQVWTKLLFLNDKVYETAMKLEKYDNSNKITPELIVLHKRYDLLRTILWQQFILAKKKCGVERNTVVYLYQYRDPSIETRGIQGAISNYLTDLDNKYPDKIVLIPIAADLDLSSLELMKSFYGIDSYPIVIVNEKYQVQDLNAFDSIETNLDLNNSRTKK